MFVRVWVWHGSFCVCDMLRCVRARMCVFVFVFVQRAIFQLNAHQLPSKYRANGWNDGVISLITCIIPYYHSIHRYHYLLNGRRRQINLVPRSLWVYCDNTVDCWLRDVRRWEPKDNTAQLDDESINRFFTHFCCHSKVLGSIHDADARLNAKWNPKGNRM